MIDGRDHVTVRDRGVARNVGCQNGVTSQKELGTTDLHCPCAPTLLSQQSVFFATTSTRLHLHASVAYLPVWPYRQSVTALFAMSRTATTDACVRDGEEKTLDVCLLRE